MMDLVILIMLFMSLNLIEDLSFIKEGSVKMMSGFLMLVVDNSYKSYSVKSLIYIISIVLGYSVYHFIGYTEEVWCSVIFSGTLVGIVLLVMVVMWFMLLWKGWNVVMGDYILHHQPMSWWMLLSKAYHHVSTPMVMLLRVFMNFLIGQVGKWGLVIASSSLSVLSLGVVSLVFFMYELMVVVLQSFIFVILSYEVLGLLYPDVVGGGCKSHSKMSLAVVVLVVMVCVLG
uniref:ATP synthase F0 subunit 6 n=1 Tax=Philometra sp. HZ-2022 TaxID=3016125 RepID=A0A9F1UCE7_9BILA|nr:ATP synthase F0 subunit 6 [Philometra sp. HZ-2022]